MVKAIERLYAARIQDAAYDYQRSVETQERIVVGVNRFQIDEEPRGLLQVIRQ